MKKILISLITITPVISFLFNIQLLAGDVTYRYDALNRLITAEYEDGSAITYTYDEVGKRIREDITYPLLYGQIEDVGLFVANNAVNTWVDKPGWGWPAAQFSPRKYLFFFNCNYSGLNPTLEKGMRVVVGGAMKPGTEVWHKVRWDQNDFVGQGYNLFFLEDMTGGGKSIQVQYKHLYASNFKAKGFTAFYIDVTDLGESRYKYAETPLSGYLPYCLSNQDLLSVDYTNDGSDVLVMAYALYQEGAQRELIHQRIFDGTTERAYVRKGCTGNGYDFQTLLSSCVIPGWSGSKTISLQACCESAQAVWKKGARMLVLKLNAFLGSQKMYSPPGSHIWVPNSPPGMTWAL